MNEPKLTMLAWIEMGASEPPKTTCLFTNGVKLLPCAEEKHIDRADACFPKYYARSAIVASSAVSTATADELDSIAENELLHSPAAARIVRNVATLLRTAFTYGPRGALPDVTDASEPAKARPTIHDTSEGK